MFKSTKDYDNAILKILTSIRDNNSFPEPTEELSEVDLGDVVNLCYQRGYIDGISVERNTSNYYIYSACPRITYQGLQFIEQFNQ